LLSPFSFNNNSCLNSIISTFFAAISFSLFIKLIR
jgi:hypothetical protein